MNEDNVKLAVTVTATALVVGFSIHQYIKVHRIETAKRVEIQKNAALDIAAIRAAGVRAAKKLEDGEASYKSLMQVMDDLRTDIEFQKIAIREL